MVGLNTGVISMAEAPFGGIEESGMSREGSHYGVDDYLDIRMMRSEIVPPVSRCSGELQREAL